MPLLKTEAVTRAMWAIVARGAVSGVRRARDSARVIGSLPVRGGELGEDRLMFSSSGALEGLACNTFELISSRHFCLVSDSMRSTDRRTISNALRRSPV